MLWGFLKNFSKTLLTTLSCCVMIITQHSNPEQLIKKKGDKTMLDAKSTFISIVKGKNFMTPEVLDYFDCGKYVIELSYGTGISNEPVYGVTVADVALRKSVYDLSKPFFSKNDAMAYIETFKEVKK